MAELSARQVYQRVGVKGFVRVVAIVPPAGVYRVERVRCVPVDRDAVNGGWCPVRGRTSMVRMDRFLNTRSGGFRLVGET